MNNYYSNYLLKRDILDFYLSTIFLILPFKLNLSFYDFLSEKVFNEIYYYDHCATKEELFPDYDFDEDEYFLSNFSPITIKSFFDINRGEVASHPRKIRKSVVFKKKSTLRVFNFLRSFFF